MKLDKARSDARAPYAGYDVLAKWNSPSFDDRTREAVSRRLRDVPPMRFFSQEEFGLVEALVRRLAPAAPGLSPELIARWIDQRLDLNLGEGFRKDGAPPLQERWRLGLAAIDAEARRLFSAPFVALETSARDITIRVIQNGEGERALWGGLDPGDFFTDTLLKTIAGLVYTHPSAWSDIGFGGPASPRGYVRLGFDARDPWEAKEWK
ncbi:gluconate 2-dehydrogenase subunit 3 family protein [Methylocystis sp. IM3]|uniref:gluconate 2-dehydrogenase subunit 3 family protein n=1 Tax=unclassified Methylocystis TaxID=2625913 RepID=UPI0030F7B62D